MKKIFIFLLIITALFISSCSSKENNNSNDNGPVVTESQTKISLSGMSDFNEYFTLKVSYDSSRLPVSITITPKSGVTVVSVSYSRYYTGKWQSREYAVGGACSGMSGGMLTQCRQYGYYFNNTYAVNSIGTVAFNNDLEGFYKWFNLDSTEYFSAVIYI